MYYFNVSVCTNYSKKHTIVVTKIHRVESSQGKKQATLKTTEDNLTEELKKFGLSFGDKQIRLPITAESDGWSSSQSEDDYVIKKHASTPLVIISRITQRCVEKKPITRVKTYQ